jgi:MFS superfamily sulfate permease-like transporter
VLSKPVLVGYITGVGLTLLSSQIAASTGVDIESASFFPVSAELFREQDDIDGATLAVGVGTLTLVLVLRRIAPKMPGALIGVAAATLFVWLVSSGNPLVAVVGEIPEGLPTLGLPDVSLDDLIELLPVAAGIVLVGFTDNVLTARSIASRHGYRIEPNQELLALGLTNLSAGLSQGFPVSSSASRTAVPASLGSKTQVVSLVAAAVVIATLLVLSPVLAQIPRAALAAVIVAAALSIVDIPGYRALWRVSRQEAALAVGRRPRCRRLQRARWGARCGVSLDHCGVGAHR